MTGATISQPGQQNLVICKSSPVAMQAPTHVQILAWLSHRHPAELPMAGLTVHSCSDMRAVVKVNEIRQDEYWNPLDWLSFKHCIRQFLLVGILDRDLLMAAPTFGLSG
jgi:hypothetical protein